MFLASEETKFKVDTTSIILGCLYNFRNINKQLFRYLKTRHTFKSCNIYLTPDFRKL